MTNSSIINIGDRPVGPGFPCFIVAEIGQAHDGSLGTAHAYIDAVAAAGVDAVKFQTHIASKESTPSEPFRVRFSPQDKTRYDYWRRMEFTPAQWAGLADHARKKEKELVFLSSPFSLAAVELLQHLDVSAWKIAAGELGSLPMLDAIAESGKPLLLSTGMAAWQEIDAVVSRLQKKDVPLALLQCTTAYPCPPEQLGLNVLQQLRKRYGYPVGLSDHSGKIYAGLAAATLGANILEVHVTFSRECFGPDVPASLTTAELAQLVEGVRFIERAMDHPVDKDSLAAKFGELRRTFGKSVVAARSLDAGRRLAREDLAFKKPGTGLASAQWERLLGRVLKRDVPADHFFNEDDLE